MVSMMKLFVGLIALSLMFLSVQQAESEELKPLRSLVDGRVVITGSERSYITKRCIAAYAIADLRFSLKGKVVFESNYKLWVENLNYIETYLHSTGSTKEEIMRPLGDFYKFYNSQISENDKSLNDLVNNNVFHNDFYLCEFLASRVAGFLELYNR